jgi:phosphoglycolate phosphatase-like HAD superfamily hydrolase
MLFIGDSLHDGEIAEREGIPFVGLATTFSPERFTLRFPQVPVIRRFSALPNLF